MLNSNTYYKSVSVADRKESETSFSIQVLFFWLFHMFLGLALHLGPDLLATLHGLGTIVLASIWTISPKQSVHPAFLGSYIVGCEVLWRMNGASLFWEFAKYALILIFLLSIFHQRKTRFGILPTLYFLFLLPAIVPTISQLGFDEARQAISFNLSGPLAITVSAWYFSQVQLSQKDFIRIGIVFIAPILSITSILLFASLSSAEIQFANASNYATSGGYGPNQVSTVLGLGFIIAVLIFITLDNLSLIIRIASLFVALWLLVQALLTFSRGGVLVGVTALILVYVFHSLTLSDFHFRQVVPTVFASILILSLVLPTLNDFTKGYLEIRFTSTDTTGRNQIVEADIQTFLNAPVTGIGVGLGVSARKEALGIPAAAHTEYSRVIAEHGLLGISAYVLLGIALIQNVFRCPATYRFLILMSITIALLTMAHSSTRLALVSFLIGFSFISIEDYETN